MTNAQLKRLLTILAWLSAHGTSDRCGSWEFHGEQLISNEIRYWGASQNHTEMVASQFCSDTTSFSGINETGEVIVLMQKKTGYWEMKISGQEFNFSRVVLEINATGNEPVSKYRGYQVCRDIEVKQTTYDSLKPVICGTQDDTATLPGDYRNHQTTISLPRDMTSTLSASSFDEMTSLLDWRSFLSGIVLSDIMTNPGAGNTAHFSPSVSVKGESATVRITLEGDTKISTNLEPVSYDSRGRAIRRTCICRCRNLTASPSNMTEVTNKAMSIKTHLVVTTRNLTKTIIQKISRKDERTSSNALGVMTLLMVSVPFAALLFADFLQLCMSGWNTKRRRNEVKVVRKNTRQLHYED